MLHVVTTSPTVEEQYDFLLLTLQFGPMTDIKRISCNAYIGSGHAIAYYGINVIISHLAY